MSSSGSFKRRSGKNKRRTGVLARLKMFNYFGRKPSVGKKRVKTPKMGKTARVVVSGARGVGKTAILEQLINGNVTKATTIHPTIEDIYVANVESERGTREKLRFYDTAGLDHSTSSTGQSQLGRQFLALADGYVLVYDTERPDTLDVLVALKRDIDRNREKKELPIIVLGNRSQPNTNPASLENTASKAAMWAAREKARHYEVNAMERLSLMEPFVHLASKLNPPPSKSSFPQLSIVRKAVGRPSDN